MVVLDLVVGAVTPVVVVVFGLTLEKEGVGGPTTPEVPRAQPWPTTAVTDR